MNIEKIEVLCQAAVNKWGVLVQLNILLEELGELIVALTRFLRGRYLELNNFAVCEEAVDAFLMIMQYREMIGHDEFDTALQIKMNRLESRINK